MVRHGLARLGLVRLGLAPARAERAQAERRIKGMVGELAQAKAQVKLQERRLRLAQDLVERSEGLAAKGYMARKDLEARMSAALAAEQELTGQIRQVAAVERELADLDGRLKSIPIEIAAARAELQAAEASLQQRSIDTEARRTQFVIAPIAGRVAALPVAAGQPVPAGATIAIMTPRAAGSRPSCWRPRAPSASSARTRRCA